MSEVKSDHNKLFEKQAWYSIHPTLQETGIGLGGFKRPHDAELNVDIGDFAKIECDGPNDGITVKVVKYAGERPWWKGYVHEEDEGPCWVVKSLSRPFEVCYSDGSVQFYDSMPVPDHMLKKSLSIASQGDNHDS